MFSSSTLHERNIFSTICFLLIIVKRKNKCVEYKFKCYSIYRNKYAINVKTFSASGIYKPVYDHCFNSIYLHEYYSSPAALLLIYFFMLVVSLFLSIKHSQQKSDFFDSRHWENTILLWIFHVEFILFFFSMQYTLTNSVRIDKWLFYSFLNYISNVLA